MLFWFPRKKMSQKTKPRSSWATSIYILLRGFINHARNKRNKSLLLPQLSTGSSDLVNEACVGSIGVNLLFLLLLVWMEPSGNGNQPETCTPTKGIVSHESSCSGPSPLVISILPFSNFNTPTSLWLLLWTIFYNSGILCTRKILW